jgi:hypothetical protein
MLNPVILYIMNNIKNRTFADLTFHAHANVSNGVQAKLDLGNDIAISVVSMKKREGEYSGLYGDVSEGTYEVAVFHNNDMLPLSPYDDVVGWQSEAEVTELMSELQGKPEDIHAFISQLHLNRKLEREDLGLE